MDLNKAMRVLRTGDLAAAAALQEMHERALTRPACTSRSASARRHRPPARRRWRRAGWHTQRRAVQYARTRPARPMHVVYLVSEAHAPSLDDAGARAGARSRRPPGAGWLRSARSTRWRAGCCSPSNVPGHATEGPPALLRQCNAGARPWPATDTFGERPVRGRLCGWRTQVSARVRAPAGGVRGWHRRPRPTRLALVAAGVIVLGGFRLERRPLITLRRQRRRRALELLARRWWRTAARALRARP